MRYAMDYKRFQDIENELRANMTEINYYVSIIDKKYKNFDNSKNMGIYIFWYKNQCNELYGLNRIFSIDGPLKIEQKVEWNWNLDDEFVCLYIGKTRNFRKRIGLHLLLDTENLGNIDGNKLYKKTTSCQLRSGFDYLYSKNDGIHIKDELMKHLYLSIYFEDNFIHRFYLENYLVGRLRPWFNVDSER